MKKLVVTGASGFLGRVACRLLKEEFEVLGLYRDNRPDVGSIWTTRADLTDMATLRRLLAAEKPQAILHLAAMSRPGQCAKDPAASRSLNIEASAALAGLAADLGATFVFASTDMVFDGTAAPYAEDAPVNPTNLYGEHKAEAERQVAARNPDARICRLALLYGPPGPYGSNYFTEMLQALAGGREVPLFSDEFRTPLSCRDAARGLRLALDALPGIYHLAGPERLSRLAFGTLAAEVLGLPAATIRPASRPPDRPPDLSLDITKALGIGFSPGQTRNELEAVRPEL